MHTLRVHQVVCALLAVVALAQLACAVGPAYTSPARFGGAVASASAASAYSQFRPPAAQDVLRRRQADASARAEQARERQLRAMLVKIVELERQEANSLDECDEWANLNDRYMELAGPTRRPRTSEFLKNQQCRELEQAVNAARTRLGQFRQLLLSERDQLEFVSQLLGDYADLRDYLGRDELLVREYDALLDSEPQVRTATANLDSFVRFVEDSLPRLGGVAPAPVQVRAVRATLEPQPRDHIEQLDRSIRALVDRELELDDDELRRLNELADNLEQVLASGQQVDINSGRFRYLSGSLDAARAVLVHKLNEPGQPPQVAQYDLPPPPQPRPPVAQIGFLSPRPATVYEQVEEDEDDNLETMTFAEPGAAAAAGAAALAFTGSQQPAADPRLADEFRAQYEHKQEQGSGSVSGALAQAEAAAAAVDAAQPQKSTTHRPAAAAQAQAASQAGASSSAAGASAQAMAGSAVRSNGEQPQQPSAGAQAVALAASYAQQQQQAQQQHQQQPPLKLSNVQQGGATATAAASAQSAAFTSPAELMSRLRSRRFAN